MKFGWCGCRVTTPGELRNIKKCALKRIVLKVLNAIQFFLGISFLFYTKENIETSAVALGLLGEFPIEDTLFASYVLCILMVAVSIFGVFCLCLNKRYLILCYLCLCVVIFAPCIVAIVFGSTLDVNSIQEIESLVKDNRDFAKKMMNVIHTKYFCCGYNSAKDYPAKEIPTSCCPATRWVCHYDDAYDGCKSIVEEDILEMTYVLLFGGIGYFFLLLAIVTLTIVYLKTCF